MEIKWKKARKNPSPINQSPVRNTGFRQECFSLEQQQRGRTVDAHSIQFTSDYLETPKLFLPQLPPLTYRCQYLPLALYQQKKTT